MRTLDPWYRKLVQLQSWHVCYCWKWRLCISSVGCSVHSYICTDLLSIHGSPSKEKQNKHGISIVLTSQYWIMEKEMVRKLALNINWLHVWESAQDKGPHWTRITQSFFKVPMHPLFRERCCSKCSTMISHCEHLVDAPTSPHVPMKGDYSHEPLIINYKLVNHLLKLKWCSPKHPSFLKQKIHIA